LKHPFLCDNNNNNNNDDEEENETTDESNDGEESDDNGDDETGTESGTEISDDENIDNNRRERKLSCETSSKNSSENFEIVENNSKNNDKLITNLNEQNKNDDNNQKYNKRKDEQKNKKKKDVTTPKQLRDDPHLYKPQTKTTAFYSPQLTPLRKSTNTDIIIRSRSHKLLTLKSQYKPQASSPGQRVFKICDDATTSSEAINSNLQYNSPKESPLRRYVDAKSNIHSPNPTTTPLINNKRMEVFSSSDNDQEEIVELLQNLLNDPNVDTDTIQKAFTEYDKENEKQNDCITSNINEESPTISSRTPSSTSSALPVHVSPLPKSSSSVSQENSSESCTQEDVLTSPLSLPLPGVNSCLKSGDKVGGDSSIDTFSGKDTEMSSGRESSPVTSDTVKLGQSNSNKKLFNKRSHSIIDGVLSSPSKNFDKCSYSSYNLNEGNNDRITGRNYMIELQSKLSKSDSIDINKLKLMFQKLKNGEHINNNSNNDNNNSNDNNNDNDKNNIIECVEQPRDPLPSVDEGHLKGNVNNNGLENRLMIFTSPPETEETVTPEYFDFELGNKVELSVLFIIDGERKKIKFNFTIGEDTVEAVAKVCFDDIYRCIFLLFFLLRNL
jgi:hypothetical protein